MTTVCIDKFSVLVAQRWFLNSLQIRVRIEKSGWFDFLLASLIVNITAGVAVARKVTVGHAWENLNLLPVRYWTLPEIVVFWISVCYCPGDDILAHSARDR